MSLSYLLLTLSLLTTSLSLSPPSTQPPSRLTKSMPLSLRRQNNSQEYIELTAPLPSDHLTPSCSLLVLRHTFADTIGRPPISVEYSPPSDCAPPWSHAVLEMRAASEGEQYDRIAAVWLAGAEILRTSTAEPNADGVFWKVRSDVTRYSSLLQLSNLTLTVMLENVVNDELTGVYDVNLTLLFYKGNSIRVPLSHGADRYTESRKLGLLKEYRAVDFANKESKLGLESEKFRNSLNFYETPADLIIPISNVGDDEGFWFRIESEMGVHSRGIQIPPNTFKAVLEVYVSFHGNDEFWYSNPPDSYISTNNLTTGRGHGSYREVFVTIDRSYVGSVVPFPVIFTGGINPLFWEPVVAIGAFNVPSYDFDLTPFLGIVLDGKVHSFGLGVADSIPFWLVDANLHLWLEDHGVEAYSVFNSHTPALSIQRRSRFQLLDGSFKIDAKRKSRFSGWVKSSAGNLTTHVSNEFKFKNLIRFDRNGTYKRVAQKIETKTEVKVVSETGSLISRTKLRRKYPLRMITSTLSSGSESDSYLMLTNVSHSLKEKLKYGEFSSSLHNSQDSWGWMMVKDHSVLSGSGNTNQSFSSKDDEFGCYSRIVSAADGRLIKDNSTFCCPSSF